VHDRSLEGLKAQNEVRTTLLQGLGGVALLVGAYFTYRQVTNSREQLAHSRDQLQIAQQGQITERFTRAIDQLGHPQLDVRLGGIYALERIASDSPADRVTIGEILTAFVRGHAPWPPRLPGQYVATAPIAEVPELQIRAADVQATLTVLGRGGFDQPARPIDRLDLHAVDLRHANLIGAHLEHADLVSAHLEQANLALAQLADANLASAHLEQGNLASAQLIGAHLEQAHLEQAMLFDTNLAGANLAGVDLRGAHLERATLTGARLDGANLAGADLRGAHLERAKLGDTRMEGAVADKRTAWPEGFRWRAAGIIPSGEDAATKGS
jgi:uncharacterized protein YjbI with pentapeptide repeats